MTSYTLPKPYKAAKLGKKKVYLVASGDLRQSANQNCWAAQAEMEKALTKAIQDLGWQVVRAHPYKEDEKHGFIGSQKEGLCVFAGMDPSAPVIVAESVWQYSHHVYPGLLAHQGPILTCANWSGTWPGLVGMLNLNGCLTKAKKPYATIWSEDFTDDYFRGFLQQWLTTGTAKHKITHVKPLSKVKVSGAEKKLGEALAAQLRKDRAIMGIFDEGCMGMYNAIIQDELLNAIGVFKERLSQAALCYAVAQVPEAEARAVYQWLLDHGMKFKLGRDEQNELTEHQILTQCKMYISALRMADEFGCQLIGIQYQQGLKDMLPASDLVEGMLNDSVRPPVKSADGKRELYAGRPLPHFNEVDECAGLDALFINRVHTAMGQPMETSLHDVRWGDWDQSGTVKDYVWVFEISGSVPASHFSGGWAGAVGERQPAMYFKLGGSTVKGISKPGEIIWSRLYVEGDQLFMDLGRGGVVELPQAETERRWKLTTSQWPIMHAVTYGVSRDQFMAKHKANHVQVVYANSAAEADKALLARAAMAQALGIKVNVCGTKKDGKAWA